MISLVDWPKHVKFFFFFFFFFFTIIIIGAAWKNVAGEHLTR